MNISDISQSDTVKADKPTKKKIKKKKIIIITLIAILTVAAVWFTCYGIYCLKMYNRYVKPFISNEHLSLDSDSEDGKMYTHFSDDLTYVFSATVGIFPYSNNKGFFSAQLLDGEGYDESDNRITDHTLNLTYSLQFDGTVYYDVYITEYGSGEKKDRSRCSQIWFTPDMEYVEGYCIDDIEGKDYKNTDEVKEVFEKYKNEIKKHLEMLWDFFGKENFKSQDKIVRLMKDGENESI